MALVAPCAIAQPGSFNGEWAIDLRSFAQRKSKVECGVASFKLSQRGDQVTGDHSMAPAGCGRMNEGGEGTVKGVVVGSTAVLAVTSGRNGQVVLGTANVQGGALHWRVREEIKPGEPEGDSGLILNKGIFRRVTR